MSIVIAIAVLILPGFFVAWLSGVKGPAAIASAIPVTFGIAGFAAWMWGTTSQRFNLVTFLITWLIILALAAVWRWAFALVARRRGAQTWWDAFNPGEARKGSFLDPFWILPGAGVITGAWLFISKQMQWLEEAPHGLNNIFQGWDVQWHANSVRFIMEEGIASPTRMGELQSIETNATLLYPSAFHALTALFAEAANLDPIPALNIMSIVAPGLALPLSVACLAWVFVGNRGMVFQIGAGIAAIAVYMSPVIVWITNYVGAWPYMVAVGITGMVIAQFVGVVHHHAAAISAMLGLLGVVQLHPAAITIVAIPVALYWLLYLLFAPVQNRIKDFLWLALPAVAGIAAYAPQLLAGSAQTEEVQSFTGDESESLSAAWNTTLTMHTRHVDDFFLDYDPTVLLALAAVGGLFVILWRRQVWAGVFYILSVLFSVNALHSFDGTVGEVLALVGSLHYNMAHRLIIGVAMIVVAAAGIGVAVLIRLLTLAPVASRRDTPAWVRSTSAVAAIVAIFVGWGATWWVTDTIDKGAKLSFYAARDDHRMVNDNDRAAYDWLATQPAAFDGLIMGEPSDGYSWAYAYNGLPTAARHYLWPTGGRGSNFDKIYWQANLLGEGRLGDPNAKNDVDIAAEELGVNFYLLSPWNFWAEQQPRWEMLHGLWTADGATPVYKRGNTVIFAVDAEFTPGELNKMRRDAIKAGSDPLPAELADDQPTP
ncbi:hypothetical protein QP027_01645 [Corynebacterium breve]|uniref:Rhamnopyranosyltransferase n=1 Tax=Corynebacterium breve TaxID=3049799 RepID=A0ABY8VF56_9CORY|nr:DUF6541 family protein [Corynebacterium breve]WIM68129.1 hypothetical protein QP027_01645 [Corynebacterium breve]